MKFFVEYSIYRDEEDTLNVTKCKGDPPAYPDDVLCSQHWIWDPELEDDIWYFTAWKTIVEANCEALAIRKGMPYINREIKGMGYK